MELEKFISESLKSIIKGVSEAQEYGLTKNALINPDLEKWDADKMFSVPYKDKDGMRPVYKIDFEISVITSENKGKKGGASINVYSLKAGGELNKEKNNENISKINFSLNIALPNTDYKSLE